MLIPYPKPINKNDFSENSDNELKVLYGLPSKVSFCKSCVISNQRPSSTVEFKNSANQDKKTIFFDKQSICDACRVKEKKQSINWKEREEELWELCDKYRSKDGKYDCLVPGSGGKDSFMQAHLLK